MLIPPDLISNLTTAASAADNGEGISSIVEALATFGNFVVACAFSMQKGPEWRYWLCVCHIQLYMVLHMGPAWELC